MNAIDYMVRGLLWSLIGGALALAISGHIHAGFWALLSALVVNLGWDLAVLLGLIGDDDEPDEKNNYNDERNNVFTAS